MARLGRSLRKKKTRRLMVPHHEAYWLGQGTNARATSSPLVLLTLLLQQVGRQHLTAHLRAPQHLGVPQLACTFDRGLSRHLR